MQRSGRHALEPTSLLGLALHDAGVLRSRHGFWEFKRWARRLESLGVAVHSGDVSLFADVNETTDQELVEAGFPTEVALRFRAALSRRAATTSLRTSRLDVQVAWDLVNGTSVSKALARVRLTALDGKLRRLGVRFPAELAELTEEDMRWLGMKSVSRRRLRRLLSGGLPETNTSELGHCWLPDARPCAPRVHMEDRVSHLLMRRAQFTGEMMDIMYHRHGVERLEDLQLLTNDTLRDVEATVFHRRRLYAALHTEVQRADVHRRYSQLPPRCKDPVRDALRFARLERFAHIVSTRLGATLAKHLAELRRVDLLAVGFGTLHRQRFYDLVRQLPARCAVADSAETLQARQRQGLRARVRAKFATNLRWILAEFQRDQNISNTHSGSTLGTPLAPTDLALTHTSWPFSASTNLQVSRTAVAHSAAWEAWTPRADPIPSRHPLGLHCRMGTLRLPGSIEQRMCLNPHDFISRKVAASGRWRDCDLLVTEWNRSDANGILYVCNKLEQSSHVAPCTD